MNNFKLYSTIKTYASLYFRVKMVLMEKMAKMVLKDLGYGALDISSSPSIVKDYSLLKRFRKSTIVAFNCSLKLKIYTVL